MTIPAKPAVYMETTLVGKPGDNVFNGASKDVAIVGKASGKWWSIIKGVSG